MFDARRRGVPSRSMTNPPDSALDGLRVLEWGSGPTLAYAGKLLAEFGADVVKLEAPAGDALRRRLPLPTTPEPATPEAEAPEAEAPQADGALHRWLNNSKRSLVLDPAAAETPLGGALLDGALLDGALLDGADVILLGDDSAPWHAASAPAPRKNAPRQDAPRKDAAARAESLRQGRPHLIVGVATDFGPDGPSAGRLGGELALYAHSGLLGSSGPHDRPPLAHGVGVSWFNGGAALAMGVVAAQLERARSGQGQVVDVAGLDTMVAAGAAIPFMVSFTRIVDRRQGKLPRLDQGIFQTADGPIACVFRGTGWSRFLEVLDDPALRAESLHRPGAQYDPEVLAAVTRRIGQLPRAELLQRAQAQRFPFAPVHDAAGVAECPQLNDRGFFIVVEGADGRHTRMPGRPFLMTATPWRMRRPAPLLGDTPAGSLGWDRRPAPSATALAAPTAGAANGPAAGPLAGVRVIELGTAWAAPFAAKALADLGAEVIKLESPRYPDNGRVPPCTDQDLGANDGARFFDRLPAQQTANVGKWHATLDFASPRGRELLLDLVQRCDVLIENYTPHTLRQHRLTYDDLRPARPDLVMLSTCGYGHSGPWQDYRALGWGLEPASGLAAVTGYADGPPVACSVPYPDMATAVHAGYAITLALEYRRRTGRGQWIDLSQYEVAALSAAAPLLHYLSSGELWGRHGNRHPWYAPHNLYPAAGDGTALGSDDQWVAIAVEQEPEWARLVSALNGVLTDRPQWRTVAGRKAGEDAIDAAIGEWTRQRTAAESERTLQAAGVRAAAVLRYDQVMRHPQLWHRGALVRADQPVVGPRIVPGPWQRLSRTPAQVRRAAAPYAAHNDLVFGQILALDTAEMESLRAAGVIGDTPAMAKPRRGGVPVERLIEQGRARGRDTEYQAWNAAGPAVPYVDTAPLAWLTND